jgi:5'-phosphate synthase pdxT subunit
MNPTLGPVAVNAPQPHTPVAIGSKAPIVGLLAIQGDFAMHRRAVEELGAACREVRTVADLGTVDGLIMPGGESTTMRKLLKWEGLWDEIPRFAHNHPIMGTCAGLILLGKTIIHPRGDESTFGLIDIDSDRNAYGSQYHSFRQPGFIQLNGSRHSLEMVFIRAPKIARVGPGVEILGRLGDEPTMVRQGNILALTFHPEMGEDREVHRYFLTEMVCASANTR